MVGGDKHSAQIVAGQRHEDLDIRTSCTASDLGTKAARALRWGDTYGSENSRSAALRSFLVGGVNAGWTFDRIREAVLNPVNVGGRKIQDAYQTRGAAHAMKLLRREYESARRYVSRNQMVLDRNGAYLRIVEWLEAIDRTRWAGAGGLTDRNALGVIAEQARRLGTSTSVPISVRRLAEEIGVGISTASRSRDRLQVQGWLRLVTRSDGTHPAVLLTSPGVV